MYFLLPNKTGEIFRRMTSVLNTLLILSRHLCQALEMSFQLRNFRLILIYNLRPEQITPCFKASKTVKVFLNNLVYIYIGIIIIRALVELWR